MKEKVCKINPKWIFFCIFCILEVMLFFLIFYGPSALKLIALALAIATYFIAGKKRDYFIGIISDFFQRK